jgi:hypothetical protein
MNCKSVEKHFQTNIKILNERHKTSILPIMYTKRLECMLNYFNNHFSIIALQMLTCQ